MKTQTQKRHKFTIGRYSCSSTSRTKAFFGLLEMIISIKLFLLLILVSSCTVTERANYGGTLHRKQLHKVYVSCPTYH